MGANLPIIGSVEKIHSRTNFNLGIAYYEDNMYFKSETSCYSCYKIEPYEYEYKGKRDKISLHDNFEKLFWNIGEEFQVIILPVESNIEEKAERLKKRPKGELKFEAIKEIDITTRILKEETVDGASTEYDTYLIVKLKNPKTLFKTVTEYAQMLVQDPVRVINKISGLDDMEIYLREFESFKQIEEITHAKMNRQAKLTKTDEYITQKLIKYLYWFGISEPPINGESREYKKRKGNDVWKPKGDIITKNGKEYLRPEKREILRLTEGDIDTKHPRYLKIGQVHNGSERVAYQAYMSIANVEDGVIPGSEWHYYLRQSLDFPVYTSIRGILMDNKVAKDELNRKRREIDDQEEHIKEAPGVDMPLDIQEQTADAAYMELDMKNNKFPLIKTTIILVVAAKSPEELQKRIDAVKSVLDPMPVEVPTGDQFLMMCEAQLGGEQYQTDYVLKVPPGQIALMTPGASLEIGDREGFYFAYTGSTRKPVYIGPWIPSQENKPPNAAFMGAQGGGKSFTTDDIGLHACKLSGAYGLWIDPKGDRTLWPTAFKTFGDQIAVTTFSSSAKDRGKLDPFVVLKTAIEDVTIEDAEERKAERQERVNEAALLATDITMFLASVNKSSDEFPYLLEAIDRVTEAEKPCMSEIIRQLSGPMVTEANEENDSLKVGYCKKMASMLTSFKKMAFSGLLFGEADDQGVDLVKQINVLQIQNLVFPDEGKAAVDFTMQETIGYACLIGISGYVKKFIMGDRGKLKIFVLDEVKVFSATSIGKNILDKLQRMARALNAPGYFIGQSPDDMGDEKVKNNIGYKFAFKTTDIDEIRKILKFYKLEETESIIKEISTLPNGHCLFQDHYGRTAVIAIDPIFDEYIEGLNTKPEDILEEVAGG